MRRDGDDEQADDVTRHGAGEDSGERNSLDVQEIERVKRAVALTLQIDSDGDIPEFARIVPPNSPLGIYLSKTSRFSNWPDAIHNSETQEIASRSVAEALRRLPKHELFALVMRSVDPPPGTRRASLQRLSGSELVERLRSLDSRVKQLFGKRLFKVPVDELPMDGPSDLALAVAERFAEPITLMRSRKTMPLVSASIAPLSMEWTPRSTGSADTTLDGEKKAGMSEPCRHAAAQTGVPNKEDRDTSRYYTFPDQLKAQEDLYYDYSIIKPLADRQSLDERWNCFLTNHSLVTLASQVVVVKSRLDAEQLTGAVLGVELTTAIDALVAEAKQVAPLGLYGVEARACLRLKLREMAASIRTVERAWILGLNTEPSPFLTLGGHKTALDNALGLLKPFGVVRTAVPKFYLGVDAFALGDQAAGTVKDATDHNPEPANHHLDAAYWRGDKFSGDNPFKVDALTHNGAGPPPGTDMYWKMVNPGSTHDSVRGWYYWDRQGIQEKLSRYIEMLGHLYPDIEAVRTAIVGMSQWIAQATASGPGDSKKLQMLAELVAGALQAIAALFEQMSEIVSAPQQPPNSIRLAFQVVYRQHWIPTAYVKGKLVGYRTLLPSESQNIKRRTFVKSSRESSRSEAFASSRQEDFSRTQKETSELLNESSSKFGFEVGASGHVDFGVAGVELKTSANGTLSELLRGTRNSISEMITKGSVSYNNKREVKIREMVEEESGEETTIQIQNLNQEITANYFYYQLIREYRTLVELHALRPVLMIAREHPTPAAIDEKFVCRYIHVLFSVLPPQLAADAQQACGDIVPARRGMLRARNAASYARAEYEALRDSMPTIPSDADRQNIADARESASRARQEFSEAELAYERLSSTVDRVVSFVRENLVLCMQRIWQSTSQADREDELRGLTWAGQQLDSVTQGLRRVGFVGGEELYEFTGTNIQLVDEMLGFLSTSSDVVNTATLKASIIDRIVAEQGVDRATAEAQLAGYVFLHEDELYNLAKGTATVLPPGGLTPQIDRVQIAQDALVVEAMPGKIPLLEGFKLAHRALDVEKACLENEHLRRRIQAEPWEKGSDNYDVVRVEGVDPNSVAGAAALVKKQVP